MALNDYKAVKFIPDVKNVDQAVFVRRLGHWEWSIRRSSLTSAVIFRVSGGGRSGLDQLKAAPLNEKFCFVVGHDGIASENSKVEARQCGNDWQSWRQTDKR